MSIPAGFAPGGLPVGVQIIGPHFEEGKVLCAAYALEQYLKGVRSET